MGKTNPTTRDRICEFEEEWQAYRRALRRDRQTAFDDVLVHLREQAVAIDAQNPVEPRWTYWMAVAVAQENQLRELRGRVEALEGCDEK